jgi:hypothetical protein
MKNIHLLPTDKPSRLHFWTVGKGPKLELCELKYSHTRNTQHIYITNDEEIKEEGWFLESINNIIIRRKCISNKELLHINGIADNGKKIILTTDQDLIEDGVQAIDDEFLHWFVKNSSCEEVEIKMENYYASGALQPNLWQYKIIIPQEEPKPRHQQIIDAVGGEDRFREIAGIKPKQETLEEATKNWITKNSGIKSLLTPEFVRESFKEGAKWQQEKMYSEEEVFKLLCNMPNFFNMTIPQQIQARKEWFEQFKKK